MEKQKKPRQHRFLKKAPVLASLVAAVIGILLANLVIGLVSFPGFFVPALQTPLTVAGVLLGVLLAAWVFTGWFRPAFEGMLRGGKPGKGFYLGLFIVAYWLLGMVIPVFFTGEELHFKLTAEGIGNSVQAGFLEELGFRGFLLSALLAVWKDKNRFLPAALVSGLVFGLVHGTNVFSGADPGQTLLQVIGTVFIGIFLAALYIRSGTLWPVFFYHTAQDILAIAFSPEVEQSGIVTGAVTWVNYVDLGTSVLLGMAGIWLLRKAKTGEIRALWDGKWTKPIFPEEG